MIARPSPSPFEDADEAIDWLPLDWHPDRFDVEEAQSALRAAFAASVEVNGELAGLVGQSELGGSRALTQVLTRPGSHGPAEVSEVEAARLLEPFTALLDLIGDGVQLTGAGYLPPALVEQLAEVTGIAGWWIGKANREDLTPPVARLHAGARALGLVRVNKKTLSPTTFARANRSQPLALWRHIVSRLPVGRTEFDRQAGALTLAVIGSETPAEQWQREIRDVLMDLGWRVSGDGPYQQFSVDNPTLAVLELLAGETRHGRLAGVEPAVAATARAAIKRADAGT